MTAKRQTNFKLTAETLARLDQLAQQLGVSRTGVVERLVRHAHIVPMRAELPSPVPAQ